MHTMGLIAVLLVSSMTAQEAAPLDVVTLQDGSKIYGTITTLKGGVLSIQTDSAAKGTLDVKFENVSAMTWNGPQKLALENGNVLHGQIAAEGGVLTVTSESLDPITVPLASVKGVNLPPKKPVTHKGFVGMNGRITDGNSRTKSVSAQANYEMRTEKSRLTLKGDWNYAEDQGDLSARSASAQMKYDLFITERTFAYANAGVLGDDFADLNLRTTVGVGIGHQFVDSGKDDTNWSFYEEVGVSFFDEDFDMARDERYAAGRVSGKLDWDIIADKILFFHFHEVFFGFEDEEDVLVDTETGVRLNIIDNFYATAQVNYRWDNTPAAGTNRADTEYLWGLGYTFSF
ncbi:MAG: DUF481 domain-containing protein [Planctomycetota bacterium]